MACRFRSRHSCFGTRYAWPAAMEAALLLKETSILPAEGMETREGATSGMYALSESQLVIGLGLGAADHLVTEALNVCAPSGSADPARRLARRRRAR